MCSTHSPSSPFSHLKNIFSSSHTPHRICFADGRVGDESAPISAYGLEQNAFIYLRNKNLTQQRAPAPSVAGAPAPMPAHPAGAPAGGPAAAAPAAHATPGHGWGAQTPPKTVPSEPKPVADVTDDETGKSRISKLRQFISHFLRRRPSPQQLVDAKILPEKPAGDALAQPDYDQVRRCIEWLRKHAVTTEGLFRVSGSAQDNLNFAAKLVAHTLDIEAYGPDKLSPHTVTTGLKVYLREKTLPVIPYKFYKDYMAQFRQGDRSADAVRRNCQNLVATLPENNRRILSLIVVFLKEVAAHENENKMNPHNLGVVFGPTLMRAESTGVESLAECESQSALVEELIRYIQDINTDSATAPAAAAAAAGGAAASQPTQPVGAAPTSPKPLPKPQTTAAATVPPQLPHPTPAGPGRPPAFAARPGQHPTPRGPAGLPAGRAPAPGAQPAAPAGGPKLPPALHKPAPVPGAVVSAGAPVRKGPPALAKPAPVPGQPVPRAQSPQSPQMLRTAPAVLHAGPGAGGAPHAPPKGLPTPPGKAMPPAGHAPRVGAPQPQQHPGPQQPQSKVKVVPKFRVGSPSPASTTAPAPAQHSAPAPGPAPVPVCVDGVDLQNEMHAALAAPADAQKTQSAAAAISGMFAAKPQEAADMLARDTAATTRFVFLLGHSIAASGN